MGWMSIDPNLEEQQLLEETLRRTGLRLTPRERLGEAASLAAFVGATAALWLEGQKMLDRVGGFMRDVGQIVRAHHERWDGAGYPDGVAGEQIPLEARSSPAAIVDTLLEIVSTEAAVQQQVSPDAAGAPRPRLGYGYARQAC